jgi:hypothetical protein
VIMVEAINLDEKIVLSCHEVAFHYLGNLLQSLDYFRVFICLSQGHAHKGTYVQT